VAGPTFSITFVAGFGSTNSAVIGADAQMPNVQIDDANANPGIQGQKMARNELINVKGSDGVTRQVRIDAERSNPAKGLIFTYPI
jgi:hypothetical protein